MPSCRAVRTIRQAISPRLAIRILLNILWHVDAASHPENSKLRLLDRRIEAGRNGQRQQAAGVRRIDDAVVPQARARVIGMALRFVLGADRRPEGLFVGLAP